eukprot:Mrub_10515.p1 GENE.Mrub_10515~~Mrub_10515.p1  ORF type:complete len:191 (-),score=32.41 Mrub_10515:46-618(-)
MLYQENNNKEIILFPLDSNIIKNENSRYQNYLLKNMKDKQQNESCNFLSFLNCLGFITEEKYNEDESQKVEDYFKERKEYAYNNIKKYYGEPTRDGDLYTKSEIIKKGLIKSYLKNISKCTITNNENVYTTTSENSEKNYNLRRRSTLNENSSELQVYMDNIKFEEKLKIKEYKAGSIEYVKSIEIVYFK